MRYGLLSPKVDFVFKKIFGNEKHPEILISFLNAVMKPINPIKSVKIKNLDIEKEHIEEKDELVRLSSDKNEVELYEQRKFAILDRVSDLENAEEKGKQKGKIEVAKNLLDILDVETIAAKTGLSVGEVNELIEK